MNVVISSLVRLLTIAFIFGCAGCALVIPIVAFKFIAVLFEPDPPSEPTAVQD